MQQNYDDLQSKCKSLSNQITDLECEKEKMEKDKNQLENRHKTQLSDQEEFLQKQFEVKKKKEVELIQAEVEAEKTKMATENKQ